MAVQLEDRQATPTERSYGEPALHHEHGPFNGLRHLARRAVPRHPPHQWRIDQSQRDVLRGIISCVKNGNVDFSRCRTEAEVAGLLAFLLDAFSSRAVKP